MKPNAEHNHGNRDRNDVRRWKEAHLHRTAAVGFGKGALGYGQFGLDADTIEWVSEPLSAGVYRFGVKVTDESGNESSGSETGEVTVVPLARPAEEVSVASYDKVTNELVLSVL